MQNAEATLAVLRGLKELGVKIAIDDFGTGYSSLSYLTTFPIDTLKVDRSFVHDHRPCPRQRGGRRGGDRAGRSAWRSASSPKGSERQEQWRWLQGLGCDKFQGYLFSPPLPAAECRDLVLHDGPRRAGRSGASGWGAGVSLLSPDCDSRRASGAAWPLITPALFSTALPPTGRRGSS